MTVACHRHSPHFSKLARESGFPGKQSAQVLLAASALYRCSTIRDESCSSATRMICTLKISLGYSFADSKKRKQVDRESSLVLYQRATDRVEKRECRGRPALCRGAGVPAPPLLLPQQAAHLSNRV